MGDSGCEEIANWFTYTGSTDPGLRRELLALLRCDEPELGLVAGIAAKHEPRLAGLIREELQELPRPSLLMILRAWRDAVESNTRFSLVSERPERPLAFARRRLVRVVADVDEGGITVRLSHVPGRHPEIFRDIPKSEVVAV